MLHLPTITSLSFIFNLLIGILFTSFYLHKKTTSFLLFGGACISFATAILLVSFKEELNLPWLTHYLANLFIILSPLLLVIGLNKFNNKAVINLTPLAYLYGLCALLLVFVYNHVLSQILTSFIVAILFLYGAFILLKTH
ncbi:MAG: GGDEF domain-containing protein, partial [Pseudoalteromonas nigrifaciens]